jgi:electron transport complex protein RnfC
MTVPVHASISGTVKKIEPRLQPNNTEGLCIIIEADEGTDQGDTELMAPLDPFSCTKEEALLRIRDAGITGMGGAGFPAHVKLNPAKTVDLVIADGAECEPYLTTDEAVISEKPHLLVTGLAAIMRVTGVKRAIIGMEDNKTSLVPVIEREIRLNEYLSANSLDVRVGLCKTLYPQGGEKMLIKALANREVPSGGLPMDCGCIVQNVGTLVAIAEAFTLGKPLVDRDLTVSGGACKTPKNIRVPIGTLIEDLPEAFMRIDHDRLRKIVFGGPMMGNAVPVSAVPVQKTTSGILFLTVEETKTSREGTCIRCGRCIRNCPCRLSPVIMNIALESGDMDEAVRAGLMDCVECGSCSYICPAAIKLVQRFRVGKQRLRAIKSVAQQAIKAQADSGSKAAADAVETAASAAAVSAATTAAETDPAAQAAARTAGQGKV